MVNKLIGLVNKTTINLLYHDSYTLLHRLVNKLFTRIRVTYLDNHKFNVV